VANFRHEDYEFLIRLAWRTWKTLPLKGELVRKPLKIECLPDRRLYRKSQQGKPPFLREVADTIAPAQVQWRKRFLFISLLQALTALRT